MHCRLRAARCVDRTLQRRQALNHQRFTVDGALHGADDAAVDGVGRQQRGAQQHADGGARREDNLCAV